MNPRAKYRKGDTAATIILHPKYGRCNIHAKDVMISAMDKDSNKLSLIGCLGLGASVHNIGFCDTKNKK